MGSEGTVLFLLLFSCHVLCEHQEEASPSVHEAHRKVDLPNGSVRLGVFAVVDDNIGNQSATLDDYMFYVAGLVGGVNINLMQFTKPTVKLGLLGVHNLTQEEKERITTDEKVNFNATYQVIQEIKTKELRAREADIIYVLTNTTIFSGRAGKMYP
ncbi:uncharacterized protein LOC135392549 [Ornithodoros turicata]|uniref:uncharacterized protein LOC135392549 n=1 Tax=Ornithodoros turicata TaxID=34597 RepID=UPI003138B2FE